MKYEITYESSYTHNLTGRRNPSREIRASIESARIRITSVAQRNGLTVYSEVKLGEDLYLDFGPTFGAHIESV